ncbi:MAG TPA: hypothetical protein DEA55_09170 [Rhodospirillaceae bacterium]|nr:hypothetical protein [Rhodospirillaceae bacterium]
MSNLKIVFSKSSNFMNVGTVMDRLTDQLSRKHEELPAEKGKGRSFIVYRCGRKRAADAMDEIIKKVSHVTYESIGPYHRTPV